MPRRATVNVEGFGIGELALVEIGGRPFGYSSFSVDLTPQLRIGALNVLAVKLTPQERSSRFYPGAGIYRNVWLEEMSTVHVVPTSVYVTTPDVSTR